MQNNIGLFRAALAVYSCAIALAFLMPVIEAALTSNNSAIMLSCTSGMETSTCHAGLHLASQSPQDPKPKASAQSSGRNDL